MTGARPTSQTNPSPFNQLRQQMADSFSLDDMRTLCFDLNINFDELPHVGLTPKIRDLILLLKQNGRLAELLTAVGPRGVNVVGNVGSNSHTGEVWIYDTTQEKRLRTNEVRCSRRG